MLLDAYSRTTTMLALSVSSGIVSVLGSATIIIVLLRSPKRLNSTYRRLVFCMSCMDILHSLCYVSAGLPTPHDDGNTWARNSIGTITTCSIQGFMNYVGCMGSLLYDCMLSIYFVMVVVYSQKEDFIQKTVEPFFHALSLLIPLAVGIFLMATSQFNASGEICWIAPYPLACAPPYAKPDVEIECTRGKNAVQYRWYFQGVPILLIVIVVITCMLLLSCSIRKQMQKMKNYGATEFSANVARKRASMQSVPLQPNLPYKKRIKCPDGKSKAERNQTFVQAALYVLALLMTFLFAFVYQIFRLPWMYVLEMTFIPLLGFFNFFIFIRPRLIMTRQCKPELSSLQVFVTAISSKEIKPPSRRRGSMISTMRRNTQAYYGRRSSQTFVGRSSLTSHDILEAAQIVQKEELKEEIEVEDEIMRDLRSTTPHNARKTSMSCDILAAAQIVRNEDFEGDEETNEGQIENGHNMEFELGNTVPISSVNSNSEHDGNGSDSLSNCCEIERKDNPSEGVDDTESEEFNLTDDYQNML